MKIHNNVLKLKDEVKRIRRLLHQIPEVGYDEIKTQAFIINYLQALSVDRIEIIAETGVKAVIQGISPTKTIALRADMDGLSVNEENQHDFVSKHKGMMHACGHDGHMTILLGLASLLAENRYLLKDNVVLLFQPAEESVGGAKRMILEGALDSPKVDMIYGLHIMPDIVQGKLGIREGPVMAQTCEFDVKITGRSSHGAMPQHGIDTIVAAAQFINGIQTIITRNIDPYEKALITVGKMNAGERRNIIAEHTSMEGMIRSFNDSVYHQIKQRLLDILSGLENSFHVKTAYEEVTFYPVVNNHPETTKYLTNVVAPDDILSIPPLMIAEDFSFFQKEIPGTYFFLGSRNSDKGMDHPLHSNRFNFDEEILLYGIETYYRLLGVGV